MAATSSTSRRLLISAGAILPSQWRVGDAIGFPLDLQKRFSIAEQMDPKAAWTMIRAISPEAPGIRGPIGGMPLEDWHNHWPNSLAFVISNDREQGRVWALCRWDDLYFLIVREYA